MAADIYTGPVRYQDGWHHALVESEDSDTGWTLGPRLSLDTLTGDYRYAADDDISWHDRVHGKFVTIELEDKTQPGLTVNPEEFEAMKAYLEHLRRGDEQ